MYCVIHILIHKHSFFLFQITINMSEQITQQSQNQFEEMINNLSPEAKTILIKISLNWQNIVGAFGSYVNTSSLEIAHKAKEPWSANKLTDNGRGRNGVVYELIPMLEKYNLIIKNINKNYTVYMLTDLGKEVIGAMLYREPEGNY
jgi:hypothetical protein